MNVLGIRYNNVSLEHAVHKMLGLLRREGKSSVFYLNFDCLYKAQLDPEYRDILERADLVLPDGIGLKLVTALFGGRTRDNCDVTECFSAFLRELAGAGARVFLLGSEEGIAAECSRILERRYPGLRIVGTHPGFFEDGEAIARVNSSGAEVLLVGMGAPLQEKWIARWREQLNPKVCAGVGALFNWVSGRQKRAPAPFRKLHLEWFWRVLIEPRRMVRRYLVDGLGFLFFLVYYRLTAVEGPEP